MSGLSTKQLHQYIVKPALEEINLGWYSKDAVMLLLFTAQVESGLKYLHQVKGPALGLWQMEKATHDDLHNNFLTTGMKSEIKTYCNMDLDPVADDMVNNLSYACLMARAHYRRFAEPLPSYKMPVKMFKYYKKYYNTQRGATTLKKFLYAYKAIMSSMSLVTIGRRD